MADGVVSRRFLQEVVKIWYSKGKTRKKAQIRTETVKVTRKQDSETFTASESVQAYAIAFGGKTYEIQLSGIDPIQKSIFEYIFKTQDHMEISALPTLATYYYDNKTGKVKEDHNFRKVWIEEISEEDHKPYDIKLGALWEESSK